MLAPLPTKIDEGRLLQGDPWLQAETPVHSTECDHHVLLLELPLKKSSSRSEEEDYYTGFLSILYPHGTALERMFGRGWGRSACPVPTTVFGESNLVFSEYVAGTPLGCGICWSIT